MKVIQHSEPWEHFEVHDFLDPSDFNSVKIYAESLPLNADRTMNVLR